MWQSLIDNRSKPGYAVGFIMILSLICALILSILASALQEPIELARELDRSNQMLIAAKILNHEGFFTLPNEKGETVHAKFEPGAALIPDANAIVASRTQLKEMYNVRLIPYLVNREGKLATFKEAGIDENEYVAKYKKKGYYTQPWMLIYKILPNPKEGEKMDHDKEKAIGWVIPVNGYGLWDAIYGYIAIKPDGNEVIGISWYDQKETPGLGANIAEAPWQNLFPGKHIFQESPDGTTDFKTAPLGITVIKGKVSEVFGSSPKAKSAVDGMAGATLTGNGVTAAYKDVLTPYRQFLIQIHESGSRSQPNGK